MPLLELAEAGEKLVNIKNVSMYTTMYISVSTKHAEYTDVESHHGVQTGLSYT